MYIIYKKSASCKRLLLILTKLHFIVFRQDVLAYKHNIDGKQHTRNNR